jgi:hypothetical protein
MGNVRPRQQFLVVLLSPFLFWLLSLSFRVFGLRLSGFVVEVDGRSPSTKSPKISALAVQYF